MSLQTLRETYPWPEQCPDVPKDPHKWFNARENGKVFNALLIGHSDGRHTYAEIGTWTGGGSASWVLNNTALHVICIDTWEGSREHHKTPDYAKRLPTLYEKFCVNVWPFRSRTTPVRERSENALDIIKNHDVHPDFIYVDGSHEEDDVYNDICNCIRTFPDAVVFGDDFTNSRGQPTAIAAAVDRCYEDGIIAPHELQRIGRCWWLTRNL
jgi:hypothetical protein